MAKILTVSRKSHHPIETLLRSSFSSTFSVNTVISELDQLVLRGRLNCFTCCICETVTLDAILKSITFLTQEKWHYGILISD